MGIVKLLIRIDANKKYEGRLITNIDLDLRGEIKSNPRYVKFYLGKTSKINLFSMFD